MNKDKIYAALRIIVSLICIGGLIYLMRGRGSALKDAITKADAGWLTAGILFHIGAMILISARQMVVFKTQDFSMNMKESLSLYLIGVFFNNFLPTAAGGDAVKAVLAGKQSKRILESFISCFADRLIGMFSLVLLAAVALFFLHSSGISGELWLGAGTLIGCGFVVMFIFFNQTTFDNLARWLKNRRISYLESKVDRIIYSLNGLRRNNRYLFKAFSLSVLSQLLGILTNYFLALSLRTDVSMAKFFLVMPAVGFASMFPSLNGLGVRELGYVVFFRGLISEEKALAISFLWLGLMYLTSLLGGIIYLGKGRYRVEKKILP